MQCKGTEHLSTGISISNADINLCHLFQLAHCTLSAMLVLGYVSTAPYSFLFIFVEQNGASSHYSVFK